MKGGTAINLFHRDMPRLSVDIDVVYIHGNRVREEALEAISHSLDRAATELERRGLAVRRQASTGADDIKLFVRRPDDVAFAAMLRRRPRYSGTVTSGWLRSEPSDA